MPSDHARVLRMIRDKCRDDPRNQEPQAMAELIDRALSSDEHDLSDWERKLYEARRREQARADDAEVAGRELAARVEVVLSERRRVDGDPVLRTALDAFYEKTGDAA